MSRPSGRHDRNVAPRNSVYGPSAAATAAGTGGIPSATMLSGGAIGGGSAAGDAGEAATAAAMSRKCTRPVYAASGHTYLRTQNLAAARDGFWLRARKETAHRSDRASVSNWEGCGDARTAFA